MKWLEIIEIRITGKDHNLVESYLKQLVEELNKNNGPKMKVFSKLDLETDFSIHLGHDQDSIHDYGSGLGQHLASTLKDFGMVNHSVWLQKKNI